MGFLDKPISELSLAELQRLIRQEVSAQVPAIPTGVLALSDLDVPLVPPDVASQGQVLTYHAPGDNYIVTSPGSLSDGNAPNLSPSLAASTAVIGGIGLLNVVWSASGVSSGDPVGYDVHISATPAFTPDATTLYGTTMATSMVIKSQANGSSLIYATNYYVRLVAFDNDGAAAAGVISGATQISADIGTITAGTLIGATVETAASGQRVVLDTDGAHLYTSTGQLLVDLPTSSSKSAAFTGTLTASALISLAATLSGTTQLSTGAILSMLAGVGQPLNPPAVSTVAGGSLTAATTYYVAFSWYDGTYETQISPVVSIATTSANKTINITLPPAPSGATQARIYVNTASFVTGAGHLQTTVNPVSSSTTTLSALTSYSNAGAASSATNTFPHGTSSLIQPAGVLDTAGSSYSWSIEGNGRMRLYGPAINSQWKWYEDFLGGDRLPDEMMENVIGAGAGKSSGTSTNINPGVISLSTGTTATGSDDVAFASNSVSVGVARIRFSCYFKTPGNVPGGVNSYQIQLGLSDKNDASLFLSSGNFIAFTFVDAVTGGAFGLTSTAAGSGTFHQAVDSGGASLTLAASTYYFVEFEVNPAGTSIAWWVSGVPQTAITTHIPTAQMALRCGITKTAGTATRTLSVDAVSIEGDFVS